MVPFPDGAKRTQRAVGIPHRYGDEGKAFPRYCAAVQAGVSSLNMVNDFALSMTVGLTCHVHESI
jgi:hypothetical protein